MKNLENKMSKPSSNGKSARSWAAVIAGLGVGAYAFGVRPRIRIWGATPWEHFREWPGDELTPQTRGRSTRAITIQAAPSEIWPWILQMGQDRAGFYSYTFLENLFRAEMRNTYRLVPEWQQRSVGDDLWMAPQHRYGGNARMVVAKLEPERTLVLVMPQDAESAIDRAYAPHGSWSFHLQPIDRNSTRLIMRSIAGEHPTMKEKLADLFFWEPAHFIMEWRMVTRIKQLAEAMASGGRVLESRSA
ncbi:MAG: hypothetical protein L0Z53_22065 [Acidobacteriales bacterium]|nr:hypothetical protein [Terriglobales bacterium]